MPQVCNFNKETGEFRYTKNYSSNSPEISVSRKDAEWSEERCNFFSLKLPRVTGHYHSLLNLHFENKRCELSEFLLVSFFQTADCLKQKFKVKDLNCI